MVVEEGQEKGTVQEVRVCCFSININFISPLLFSFCLLIVFRWRIDCCWQCTGTGAARNWTCCGSRSKRQRG